MSEYMDEKIVAQKRLAEKSKYSTVDTGMYIEDELVNFCPVELFGGKMRVMLPEAFTDMDPEIATIKYPSAARPQVIQTNAAGSINFTFSHFAAQPLRQEQVKDAAAQFKTLIRRVHPANVFYDMKEEEVGGNTLWWFDYKGYAVDDQTYNLVYLVSVDGRMMHGVFNCVFRDIEEWKPAAMQVMLSVRDLTLQKEGGQSNERRPYFS